MQFSFEFSVSAEVIFERITNAQFIVDRCLALGSIEAECDSDEMGLPKITIKRVEEAELPSIMKKVIGEQQIMTTVEQWTETDESYDSKSQTSIIGTPIKIDATQSLFNTKEGSEILVNLVVKANIPLLGKKIEPMVASKIRVELLNEFKYLENESG